MRGLVVADDATGALECGSILAGLGVDCTVSLGAPIDFGVLDAGTRHMSSLEAATRIRAVKRPNLYLKTDSTLRGQIAASIRALGRVVYLPAYPAMGRTVENGRLLVHGVPVDQTEFARDPLQPVLESDLTRVLGGGVVVSDAGMLKDLLSRDHDILICDAATEQDMASYATVLAGTHWNLAGPAGFIRYWARQFESASPKPLPRVSDWSVVCGSLHPMSRKQAEVARSAGMRVVWYEDVPQLDVGQQTGLLVFGGDTVKLLMDRFGVATLKPLPEVFPGIACAVGVGRENLLVTKAGGFGQEDLALAVRERLR